MAKDVINFVRLYFIPVLVLVSQVNGERRPNTVSMELGQEKLQDPDTIQILDPPEVLSHGMWLIVEYRCSRDRIIGLEVTGSIEKLKPGQNAERKLFRKAWKCNHENRNIKRKRVKLKLPDSVAFRQDLFNSRITFVNSPKLKAWNLDPIWWPSCRKYHNAFWRATVKVSYDMQLPSPHARLSKGGFNSCPKWPLHILAEVQVKKIEICRKEPEYVHTVTFPVAINGLSYGVVRKFPKYTNTLLENNRKRTFDKPIFTLSMWMYILDYCKFSNTGLCGLTYHVNWNSTFLSPLVFVNRKGQLHIQMSKENRETLAAVTDLKVPRRQWFRLVLGFSRNFWKLTITQGEHFNETTETSYRVPGTTYLDDTEGLFVFGAFDATPSFKGYIGQATYYRNRLLQPHEIPLPSPYHAMFELDLSRRTSKCEGFQEWVYSRSAYYVQQVKSARLAELCHTYFFELWRSIMQKAYGEDFTSRCPKFGEPKSKQYGYLDRLIKRSIHKKMFPSQKQIGEKLYNKAVKYIELGFNHVRRAIPLLKQASCYDNHDAMYMLATLLNNGVKVKADEPQAQAYLMKGCLEKHRLCCLALAHKHRYGLDGVPQDLEQSFVYYKFVADTVRVDKETHKETDVLTESVRLTDEDQLREQTDEDGDVFQWLKHQASNGVFSAQQHIARVLFWGSQGMKRNMAAATEYFRLGAESQDPQAMYDYGIILLKGQGIKKNKTEGLQHIQASADKKNPSALNALGWYAHNFDKNMTAAIYYFEKAFRGGNADAAYNLGLFHLHGEYPGKPPNSDIALDYFNFAATRSQIDAGVFVSYLNMKGTFLRSREVYVAIEWARFIAEKNPELGFVLRKGLTAFRNDERHVALLYYLMAADAGIEAGSFNLAWLCEENQDGIASSIEKECQWRQYNITTQREKQFVDPYALIKMGDYYWYGCGGKRDPRKAADMYTQAAQKKDPHAIFNLGLMVEEGEKIHPSVWKSLYIPKQDQSNNYTLLSTIYRKCRDSPKSEAYLPCSMALYRVQFLEMWDKHRDILQVVSFILSGVVTVLSLRHIVQSLRGNRRPVDLDIL
ncbi:protein sel-1 homolog 3-like [Mizuhopecten yessoensis]|uniref:Protein sel-1-like 3 n=1 Tax=Mizuhopecten yessoensis TaxID=6573 RepID=A0A210QWE1_MIZYE|nr:protein sel-1 homolog 3-like [Mizuhopecten yessoensis]OWF53033.1 Protein sel-1-like 3 [Mizuhopecten yessoensis]